MHPKPFNIPPHIAAHRAAVAAHLAQPVKAPEPLNHTAIKAEADRLYASGYGKGQSYDGLQDSIVLAGRARLNAEDRA